MCRWIVFIGTHEIHLAEVVSKPEHSIFRYQAKQAGVLLANWGLKLNSLGELLNHLQRNHNINADGCGIGLYLRHDPVPLLFNSLLPAWNNRNLMRLGDRLHSRLFFAHVRAASPGSPISEVNTHPFQYGHLMWMHNGGIARFSDIRRKLLMGLHTKSFNCIAGTTDTEHADLLPRKKAGQDAPDLEVEYSLQAHYPLRFFPELAATMEQTIGKIVSLVDGLSPLSTPEEASSLNFAVSDGKHVVAARWRNAWWQTPPLLFYSTANTFRARTNEHNVIMTHGEDDGSVCEHGRQKKAVLITSEPMNSDKDKWKLVPKNHLILVDHHANVTLVRISVPLKKFRVAARQWLARARKRIEAKRQTQTAPHTQSHPEVKD